MLFSKARIVTVAAVVATSVFGPAWAQSTQKEIEEYSVERVVPLSFLLAPAPLPFPDDVLKALQAGKLEIRVRNRYTSSDSIMTSHAYLVPAGTPLPLPEPMPAGSPATISLFTKKVDSILFSDKPVPGVTLIGRVIAVPVRPAGLDILGSVHITTFGYTEGSPATFTMYGGAFLGSGAEYSPKATGTLKFKGPPPPPPPPGENRAPVAVITPATQTVLARQIQLDGTKSSDPDGDPITYSWKSTGRTAAVFQANTATPQVQFHGGVGDYTFELTVTDSKGLTGKATTTVMYMYMGR